MLSTRTIIIILAILAILSGGLLALKANRQNSAEADFTKVAVDGGGVSLSESASETSGQANDIGNNGATESVSPKSGSYKNTKYSFSLSLPKSFETRELSDEIGDYVLIENGEGDGLQITISPFDDIKVLTAEMIRADIPDMKISEVQVIEIGDIHKGVAFLSDSPEFGGSSREVWFVFRGNLYQISTYARLDGLLKQVFMTWQFTQ